MGMQFKCIDESTWNGRIVRPGETITVRDGQGKALTGHPCWELVGGESEAPKKGAPKGKQAPADPTDLG